MGEYLAPGVFIEEVEMGPRPIEGVSTTTTGFLGETERGPIRPKLVTSWADFTKLYGEYSKGSNLPYAVQGFYANGGRRAYIARITGQGAATAKREFSLPQGSGESPTASTSSEEDQQETGGDSADSKPPKSQRRKATDEREPAQGSAPAISVEAVGPGEWGKRIAVIFNAATSSKRDPRLFKMKIIYPFSESTAGKTTGNKEEESFDNLSDDPASGNYFVKKINGTSNLIMVRPFPENPPTIKDDKTPHNLFGGSDGSKVGLSDYEGQRGSGKEASTGSTGLAAFEEIDEISILCAPNEDPEDLKGLSAILAGHCEKTGDRFVILHSPQGIGNGVADSHVPISNNAAFYHPWLKTMDTLTNSPTCNSPTPVLVPPDGHIAGVYARSDIQRGVHKAPANEILRNVQGLERQITRGDQEVLNPIGINCIRYFRGRGILVWGARTTSSNALWKYINVRRLFLYVAESLEKGTQWVVFEPNSERLWPRVVQTVSQFLTGVWQAGMLMGTTPEEGFFVRCDRTTMTQDDIDNGRLIIHIGVALAKPAEFVIFRIAQWSGGSTVTA